MSEASSIDRPVRRYPLDIENVGEYIDLLASMEMLIEEAALTMPSEPTVRTLIAKKKAKHFMDYARDKCGTLTA